MPLQMLVAWWNLIYIVPFVLALLYLGLFVFTGITFGDADADVSVDADADADVDADADQDVSVQHEFNGEHDADHDAEHDSAHGLAIMPHSAVHTSVDAEAGVSPVMALLSFLGLGKIPLSLALMILLLTWGLVGFALNSLLVRWIGPTFVVGFISIPITMVVSMALTGLCAAGIAKVIPSNDPARQRRQDLIGKSGEALYDIDASFGMASVRGDAGDYFQIPCRAPEGKGRIPKGSRIVIFDYDSKEGIFHVAPFQS